MALSFHSGNFNQTAVLEYMFRICQVSENPNYTTTLEQTGDTPDAQTLEDHSGDFLDWCKHPNRHLSRQPRGCRTYNRNYNRRSMRWFPLMQFRKEQSLLETFWSAIKGGHVNP